MINPKELRLGNLLNCNNGHMIGAFKVGIIHMQDIIDNNGYGKQYEPIPLIEEILLKGGFVLKRGYYTKKHYGHIKILLHEDGVTIYVLGLRIDHIINLHQLQNLYFSLTNQELQIEL